MSSINSFRWLLSYIFEQKMECASTQINPHLELGFENGIYKLSTKKSIYSFGYRYKVFADAFRVMNIASRKIETVLSLGFGLGSVPVILSGYHQNFNITGVEIDPIIIDWTKKYLDKDILHRTELVNGDAFEFVKKSKERFDLITVDIFIDDEVPERFEKEEFLLNVKKLLKEKGLLLYNRLGITGRQRENTRLLFDERFKKIFPNGKMLMLNKNIVLANENKL